MGLMRESVIFVSVFPQNVYHEIACLNLCMITSLTLVWFFLSVYFKCSSMNRRKDTLVAFVWFYSVLILRCFPKWAASRALQLNCNALAAFVWLISSVNSQMCPQISCVKRCIITLVAFIWLITNKNSHLSAKWRLGPAPGPRSSPCLCKAAIGPRLLGPQSSEQGTRLPEPQSPGPRSPRTLI